MNVEELFAEAAHRVASDVTPPPAPDPAELGARARTRRRQRRLGAAAAATVAAVAAAAVLVPALAGRGPDPAPVEPPTSPLLGNVPAWVDLEGDIRVGDHELDLPGIPTAVDPPDGVSMVRFSLTSRGVVWREASADAGLFWQSLDGEPVELTARRPVFFTSDPLGDHVVWVTEEQEMVTYDLAQRRVVDSRPVPGILSRDVVPIGTTLPVLYVGQNSVVYEVGEDVWTLDLEDGSATRMPDVSASDLVDYGPSGAVVAVSRLRDGGAQGARSLAQLELRTAEGTLRPRGRLFREGRLSPDGRWFVTSTGYEAGLRTVILDMRTGEQVPVDLPEALRGAYPDPWGWAGEDVLVIGLLHPNNRVEAPWTCRPTLGRCDPLPEEASTVYPW